MDNNELDILNLDESEELCLDDTESGVQRYIDATNAFLEYYKKTYHLMNINVFEGVDYSEDTSTNKCMELMYECIFKYRDKDVELELPEDIDISKHDELYTLIIDNKQQLACPSLWHLIMYLVDNYDYLDINWEIASLK